MWIVSKAYDLLFFHLSTIVSLMVLALFYVLASSMTEYGNVEGLALTFYFIFAMFFDLPHIFQTFSRTHYDKDEFNRHRFAHTYGFGLIVLGSLGFVYFGEFNLWMEIFAIYGYYHILKQNIGFLMAYKYLGGEKNSLDYWIDKWGYFFIFFISAMPYFKGRPGEFVFLRFDLIPQVILDTSYIIAGAIFVTFLARQFQIFAEKRVVNTSKISLYVLTLSVNAIIHQDPRLPLVLIIVLETIYHDIQYQG